MKLLIVAFAIVASACAYSVAEIPEHMRERLDRYVAIKKQWEAKWSSMTDSEKKHYEEVLIERLEHLPQIERQRTHDRLEAMPQEHRVKLLEFLRRRFPKVESSENFDDEIQEIEVIIDSLPELIREKLQQTIVVQFQEATAYSAGEEIDTELDFVDIPDLVDIPEAAGYSESMPNELVARLDEFLLKREEWRRKWEKLSFEKREVLEAYINEKMSN